VTPLPTRCHWVGRDAGNHEILIRRACFFHERHGAFSKVRDACYPRRDPAEHSSLGEDCRRSCSVPREPPAFSICAARPTLRESAHGLVCHRIRRLRTSPRAQSLFAARGRMTSAAKPRQRRRTGPTKTDLLKTLRAAQEIGWNVEIIHTCGTIIRLRPGAAEHVETSNSRGLSIVP
jgi:hypothetical protein